MPPEIKKVELTAEEHAALVLQADKVKKLETENLNLREGQRLEAFKTQRLTLGTALEKLVVAKKVLPAVREKLDGMVSGQQATFTDKLLFTGDQVVELIEGAVQPTPKTGEQGEQHGTGELLDEGGGEGDPAVELNRLTITVAAQQKLSFSKAMELVMAANPKLAARHNATRLAAAKAGGDTLEKAGGRQ